jgi:hypothetical protein
MHCKTIQSKYKTWLQEWNESCQDSQPGHEIAKNVSRHESIRWRVGEHEQNLKSAIIIYPMANKDGPHV